MAIPQRQNKIKIKQNSQTRQTRRKKIKRQRSSVQSSQLDTNDFELIQMKKSIRRKKKYERQKVDMTEPRQRGLDFGSKILMEFLENVYYQRNFDDELFENLGQLDQQFVHYFLQSKFEKITSQKIYLDNLELKQKVQKVLKILKNSKFNKTTQQQLQFIIKHALKRMRLALIDDNIIDHHFDYSEFYEFYFRQTAIQKNLDISIFYDPRNTKTKQSKFKTYGKSYVLSLLESETFKNHLYEFLNEHIYDYYFQIAQKRFELIINKLKKNLIGLCQVDQFDANTIGILFQSTMKKEMLENKQSKLPWIQAELQQAVQTFAKMVEQNQFDVNHLKNVQNFASIKNSFQINFFNNYQF